MITFGTFDTAYAHSPGTYGVNIRHTGFYFIGSDTLSDGYSTQSLTPDDTLRVIPKPIVFKRGAGGLADDTIYIRIPNPRETRRADQTEYDIMGYLIYADTTGIGSPNAYNNVLKTKKVKFLITQGIFGDTTTMKFLESIFAPPNIEWPVYFAYKIGARPDTTVSTADTSGNVTYYFSQNSDSIHVLHNVVGVEEQGGMVPAEPRLVVAPNPFTGVVRISVEQAEGNREIRIYDINGALVKSFGVLAAEQMPFGQLYWNGRDSEGTLLPAGVYFVEVKSVSETLTQKVILER